MYFILDVIMGSAIFLDTSWKPGILDFRSADNAMQGWQTFTREAVAADCATTAYNDTHQLLIRSKSMRLTSSNLSGYCVHRIMIL